MPEGCASFGKRVEEVEETEGGVEGSMMGRVRGMPLLLGVTGLRAGRGRLSWGREGRRVRRCLRGKYAYRGLAPMEKAVGLLGEEMARNGQVCIKASFTSLKGIR